MEPNNSLGVRRRYAGIFFATAGFATLLAVLAQSTPRGSVLESVELTAEFASRARIALFLWGVASVSIVVACILVANVLRGPRTRTALLGSVFLALGALLFFTVRIATGGLRYLLGVATDGPIDTTQVDALLQFASSFTIVVVPPLVLGGSCIAIGFDPAGASSWFTGATWSIALVCYGLVDGVWWAEALTAAALALALLVMGIEVARFRPVFALTSDAGATRIMSS
ncbi:MAG TPA: hypothetical protein VGB18_03595 [Candidatus Thermoplasmatota archaeon]